MEIIKVGRRKAKFVDGEFVEFVRRGKAISPPPRLLGDYIFQMNNVGEWEPSFYRRFVGDDYTLIEQHFTRKVGLTYQDGVLEYFVYNTDEEYCELTCHFGPTVVIDFFGVPLAISKEVWGRKGEHFKPLKVIKV